MENTINHLLALIIGAILLGVVGFALFLLLLYIEHRFLN